MLRNPICGYGRVVAAMDPEPAVEQQANASVLLTVSWRAWRVMGRDCGPSCSTVLRLALVPGSPPIIERVDGQPLGVVAERCRESIEQALHELREGVRRHRTTSRHLRGAQPPAEPAKASVPPAALESRSATDPSVAPPLYARPPSGIFRCDKQSITDRIDRLKRDLRPGEARPEPKPALPQEPTSDPKTDIVVRMAALRATQAPRKPDDGVVTPFDAAPEAPVATPSQDRRPSSVFRLEPQVITDRIGRPRPRPDSSPPPAGT